MVLAQSLGEYGAGNIIGQVVGAIGGGVQAVQTSVGEHPVIWVAVCAVVALLVFRRR
jgi:hypothetical protein